MIDDGFYSWRPNDASSSRASASARSATTPDPEPARSGARTGSRDGGSCECCNRCYTCGVDAAQERSMGTIAPRIHFTPNPLTFRVIDRLATLRGCARSLIVSEYMALITQQLGHLADALEAAHDAQGQAEQDISDMLDHVHEPAILSADQTVERLRAFAERQPPSSNTGVTTFRSPPHEG